MRLGSIAPCGAEVTCAEGASGADPTHGVIGRDSAARSRGLECRKEFARPKLRLATCSHKLNLVAGLAFRVA